MFWIMVRRQTSHLFPPVANGGGVAAGPELSDHLLNLTPFPLNDFMNCGHQLATEESLTL